MTPAQNQNISGLNTCTCMLVNTDLRRLFLLDLDNLHGSGCPSIKNIKWVRETFSAIKYGPQDLMYSAYNHHYTQNFAEFEIAFAWSPAVLRPATGPDGADHALIADGQSFLNPPGLPNRIDEVVIGSGDHIFTSLAHQFKERGITVHLIVRDIATLSKRLQKTANGCIYSLNEQRCLRHEHLNGVIAPSQNNCSRPSNKRNN